jgi:C-terminal processing protease CtpA/Prc
MKSHLLSRIKTISFIVLFCLFCLVQPSFAQNKMDSIAKQQVMSMLTNVKKAIKNDYYDADPKFAGVDLETRFKAAEEKLKTTEYLAQALAIIAQVVIDLNDSHTRFYPPGITTIVEYGWRLNTIGDRTYVSGVLENSDADKKGLKIGDEVLAINGFRPTRRELWKVLYYYDVISPKVSVTFDVKSAVGETRKLVADAKLTQLKKSIDLANTFDLNAAAREGDRRKNLDRHYFQEVGDDVLIWKMPNFVFDPKDVGGLIGKAHNKKTLILDLRGNGGGIVDTLEELAGYFFDHDVKIADLKGRKKLDPQQAKSKGSNIFSGKVIVLVDANSASASEIFARLMQIEKRGIVLGDVSEGAVMQSHGEGFSLNSDDAWGYGMNMTMADVIMSDGKSLEHVGVIPDELILPSGKDLFERNDPVMSRALELGGHKIDAAVAGKFFPAEKIFERKSNVSIIFEN